MELQPTDTHCPLCGHKIGPGRIQFNKNLARLFVIVARKASLFTDNAFTVDLLKRAGLSVEYTIVAKLKYFGIIKQPFESRRKGLYHITEEGWDFLRGLSEVPKWVDVEKMRVVDRSPQSVSLEVALDSQWFGQQDWITTWRKANPKKKDPQMHLQI